MNGERMSYCFRYKDAEFKEMQSLAKGQVSNDP